MKKICGIKSIVLPVLMSLSIVVTGCSNEIKFEKVFLTSMATSSVGGDDISAQQITYEITVSNMGDETARDLRVFIDTPATNNGLTTIEASTTNPPINLAKENTATYKVTWDYDMTQSSKQELVSLMNHNVVRAEWTDADLNEHEKILAGK